jgi:ribosomal protein S18 acetylase RimI-like enzyme
MTVPEISVATPADRDRVVDTLVAAFVADPVLRYLFPDDASYPGCAAAFFGHLFDKRVHRATIWTIEHGAAVAMWDPPEPLPADGTPELPTDAKARLAAYNERVHAALPDTPHWYLGVLGTHPDRAGRRWGRAVMAPGLRRAEEDGLPVVLETSKPGNVEVYRRSGFEVFRVSKDVGPLTIWVMQRPARWTGQVDAGSGSAV